MVKQRNKELSEMLCSALEMEAKEKEFYKRARQDCPNEMGKEIFQMLAGEETEHEKGLNEIYQALQTGQSWPVSCSLMEKKELDPKFMLKKMADRYGADIRKGVGLPEALQIGIDMEQESVKFYENQLQGNNNPDAKNFLEKMVQEEKGHYLLLLDMQYYYSDPEGYFMEKEHRGLDGA